MVNIDQLDTAVAQRMLKFLKLIYIIHNEKPFTMNPGNQVHCEGFFYIKGEYENLWFETK